MARRRNSSRRRRRGSSGFLYKLLSMLAICAVIIVALTLFFRVETIVVTGTERYTAEEVIQAPGVETGDNLFLLNKPTVNQRIRDALPYVERVKRINRKLPDTLLIEVEECGTPLAVVQDGSAWLVSPLGKIVEQLPAGQAEGYAVIDGCQLLTPTVGTKIALATEYNAKKESLLDLLAALEEAEMLDQVEAIHLEDASTLTMEYGGRFLVEMPYRADYQRKLQTLRLAVEKLETNQTGTIQLLQEDRYAANFIPGNR